MSTPRGIRNNNPGNIRHRDQWKGLAEEQTDTDFCTFSSPEYGIRAMAKILRNYQRRHGLNTVAGIIGRWAPATENDTQSYAEHVAQKLGIAVSEPFDVEERLSELVTAIIVHENGSNPYTAGTITHGCAMALV